MILSPWRLVIFVGGPIIVFWGHIHKYPRAKVSPKFRYLNFQSWQFMTQALKVGLKSGRSQLLQVKWLLAPMFWNNQQKTTRLMLMRG